MSKYIMIDLNNDDSKHLSDVLSNDTCKKILNFLSENDEVTESDISSKLKLPLNTVNYNMKKLLASKLVDEAEHFFWSKKGKRIRVYRISNKSIVISPKQKTRMNKIMTSIITLSSTLLVGFLIRTIFRSSIEPIESSIYDSSELALVTTQKALLEGGVKNITHLSIIISSIPTWLWFLSGGVFALIIILILNWRKL